MLSKVYRFSPALLFYVGATAFGQTSQSNVIPPPPPPELPQQAAQPSPIVEPPPTPSMLDRYQNCFDKLIEQGSTDQKFMRHCLGLVPQTAPDGRLEFLTREELKEGDEKRTKDVTQCYAKTLQASKSLSVFPRGILDLGVNVENDGTVKSFQIGKKSVLDSTFLNCVNRSAKTWSYPKTSATKPARVRYLWTLDATKERGPKVTLVAGYPKVRRPPGLTPAEIVPVVQASSPHVRRCYEELLKVEPAAQGKVIVEMLVAKNGLVRQAKILQSELPQPSLHQCILGHMEKLKFSPPRGGKPFPVRYPFLLTNMP